jgi:putative tryptophan/tyrosine transport system substrate-binding protein
VTAKMKRRQFITLLGGAAVWPLAARAQQPSMPVVGVVTSLSSSFMERYAPALREGLNEAGYIDGRNVAVEYRSAEGYYDRLSGLVAELIDHKAAVIVAVGGSDPARIAKAATGTIPIVFASAADPIKAGLVASLNRPGGNITGVSLIGSALEAKRLDLLQQLVPGAAPFGVLVVIARTRAIELRITPTTPGLMRRSNNALHSISSSARATCSRAELENIELVTIS